MRKFIITILIILIISIVFAGNVCAEEITEHQRYLDAIEQFNLGEYEKARSMFSGIAGYSTSSSYFFECVRLLKPIELNDEEVYEKIQKDVDAEGGKDYGEILVYQAENLKSLDLSNCYINDISFLESFINLENLNLEGNRIGNILPLKDLYNLKTLALSSNNIGDITPLYNLTELEYLDLSENRLENVENLSQLVNLKYLNLSNNKIDGIAPLAGFLKLETLILNNNNISYLGALENLTQLKELELLNNRITSIMQLSSLSELEVLKIGIELPSERGISSLDEKISGVLENTFNIPCLDAIGSMTNLKSLTVMNVFPYNLNFLPQLNNIEELNFDYSRLSEEAFLSIANMQLLKKLSLNYLADTSFQADSVYFSHMINLNYLSIRGFDIDSVEGLANIANLEYLDISDLTNNKINNISFVDELSSLKHFEMANLIYVKDFSPLAALADLEYLNAAGCEISDLSNIISMQNLRYLNLNSAALNSLEGIENLENLEHIDLGEVQCKLNDSQAAEKMSIAPLGGFENLKYIDVSSDKIFDKQILLDINGLEYLYGATTIDCIDKLGNLVGTNIKELSITADDANVFYTLCEVKSLKKLSVTFAEGEYGAVDIFINEGLNVLSIANLGKQKITIEIAEHENTENLEIIELQGVSMKDLEGFSKCNNIVAISIPSAEIENINGIQNSPNLKYVYLQDNNITDISALSGKVYLEELNIDYNDVNEITAIKGCFRLILLSINDTPVTNINIIMELPILKYINMEGVEYESTDELENYISEMRYKWR